jgi:MFS family permease
MAGMFCAFLVLTVLTGINQGDHFSNAAVSRATVAMILVFGVFYKMPAPIVDSYIAEISPYDLRAKAFVIKQFGDAGANLFSSYVNPIALGAIKWKYYIVWCCVLISNFLIIYFYPETKKLPWRKSLRCSTGLGMSRMRRLWRSKLMFRRCCTKTTSQMGLEDRSDKLLVGNRSAWFSDMWRW